MPLTRKEFFEFDNSDLFSYRWPMMAGAKQVVIKVSTDALQDLAAWDGLDPTTEPKELLDAYQEEIEEAASRKYDESGPPIGDLLITAAEIRAE
jgi:hypothetical protein